MNTRYSTDDELDQEQDREISLGTTTILGIFFALALLCAVFFGFGYSMGRRTAQPVVAMADKSDESTAATTENSAPKPSPTSSFSQTATETSSKQSAAMPRETENSDDASSAAEVKPREAAAPAKMPSSVARPEPAQKVTLKTVAATTTIPKPAAVPTVALGTPGSTLVQVAAVSHQEDAELLVTALKRKGYTVAVRQVPQDKLLHVQIGPFATKKDADAMRQKLQSDGYNAIVK